MSLLKAFHGSPSFISSLPSTHAHTHTCKHTKFPAAPPQPLTPHHQHPDPIARKQGVKQEREKARGAKGRRREQRHGNERTQPQEVEINKKVEWVGGRIGSHAADNRGRGSKISFAPCNYAICVKYSIDGKLGGVLCLSMCGKWRFSLIRYLFKLQSVFFVCLMCVLSCRTSTWTICRSWKELLAASQNVASHHWTIFPTKQTMASVWYAWFTQILCVCIVHNESHIHTSWLNLTSLFSLIIPLLLCRMLLIKMLSAQSCHTAVTQSSSDLTFPLPPLCLMLHLFVSLYLCLRSLSFLILW